MLVIIILILLFIIALLTANIEKIFPNPGVGEALRQAVP